MINTAYYNLENDTRVLIVDRNPAVGSLPRFARAFTDQQGRRGTILVEENGPTYYKIENGYSTIKGHHQADVFVAWCDPLPDLSDPEILDFYAVFKEIDDIKRMTSHRLSPILIHVTEFDGAYACGKVVHSVDAADNHPSDGDENWTVTGHVVSSQYDVYILIASLPKGTAVHTLLLGSDFRCDFVEVTDLEQMLAITTVSNLKVVAEDVPTELLGRYIPKAEEISAEAGVRPIFRTQGLQTATVSDHLYQLDAGRARLEPNEALFLRYQPSDGKELALAVLSTRGIQLFGQEDVQNYFDDDVLAEGLWVLKDAQCQGGWYRTDYGDEYDFGINGDFIPATADDLDRFGFTLASVGREIFHYQSDDGVVRALPIADPDGTDLEALATSFIERARLGADGELAAPTI